MPAVSGTDLYLIETDRLKLRPVQESDAGPIASLVTPSISRWTATWPPSISVEAARGRVNSAIEARKNGLAIVFAIKRKSDEALIGLSGIHRQEPNGRRGNFGYWIGDEFHGKGYMREAAAAIVNQAWSLFDIDVIEASAQPENTASIAVLRKLGMRSIGERFEFAPVRNRDELCVYFEISRPS